MLRSLPPQLYHPSPNPSPVLNPSPSPSPNPNPNPNPNPGPDPGPDHGPDPGPDPGPDRSQAARARVEALLLQPRRVTMHRASRAARCSVVTLPMHLERQGAMFRSYHPPLCSRGERRGRTGRTGARRPGACCGRSRVAEIRGAARSGCHAARAVDLAAREPAGCRPLCSVVTPPRAVGLAAREPAGATPPSPMFRSYHP